MSYNAKVYKVFIASPDDMKKEREIVRSVLARWNDLNSEVKQIVLLPVSRETHSTPEVGKRAQDIINDDVLQYCDILIGLFWTKIGSPTQKYESGSIEEIEMHIGERKLAMLYFSQKEIPYDADIEQVKKVRELKEKYRKRSLYDEFQTEEELSNKIYNHIDRKVAEGKFRPTRDSDILSKIKDDDELVEQINGHFPLVSKRVLQNILDEERRDIVWNALIEKLKKSPADLRDSMIYLARRGAFQHKAYQLGYVALAKCSQCDFGNFMNDLYSINKYEFFYLYNQGLLEDSPFSRRLIEIIKKDEFV